MSIHVSNADGVCFCLPLCVCVSIAYCCLFEIYLPHRCGMLTYSPTPPLRRRPARHIIISVGEQLLFAQGHVWQVRLLLGIRLGLGLGLRLGLGLGLGLGVGVGVASRCASLHTPLDIK